MTTSAKQHIKSLQAIIDAHDLDERRQRLCDMGEYGLAHLLGFIRLEACCKLYMYEKRGREKVIGRLDLKGSWGFVEKLKSIDDNQYSLCMDLRKNSARKIRHAIAHEGAKLNEAHYVELAQVMDWAFRILYPDVPREVLNARHPSIPH